MEQFVGVKGSPDESGKKGTEIKNEKCQACIYFIKSVQEQCLCDKSEVGCFTLFTWIPSAYEGESKNSSYLVRDNHWRLSSTKIQQNIKLMHWHECVAKCMISWQFFFNEKWESKHQCILKLSISSDSYSEPTSQTYPGSDIRLHP